MKGDSVRHALKTSQSIYLIPSVYLILSFYFVFLTEAIVPPLTPPYPSPTFNRTSFTCMFGLLSTCSTIICTPRSDGMQSYPQQFMILTFFSFLFFKHYPISVDDEKVRQLHSRCLVILIHDGTNPRNFSCYIAVVRSAANAAVDNRRT